MSFDVILPFLRPIQNLILDAEISEIMVNGSERVFVERSGRMEEDTGVSIPEKSLQVAVRNIARALGDEIDEEKPMLDSRLPDGSRVAAIFPPCSVEGTTLTIRKFHHKQYTADELVRIGSLSPDMLQRLREAITRRENILISGGTGTGKTTLLNALAAFIPDEDRIVVIEDTSEIQIDKPNRRRLEARRAHADIPAVTIRELLRATLRHRPDRIILGEVRGGGVRPPAGAQHRTFRHAFHDSRELPQQAISPVYELHSPERVELPYRAVRRSIADAVNLLLHIERRNGRQYASELLEIRGYDPGTDSYTLTALSEASQWRTCYAQ